RALRPARHHGLEPGDPGVSDRELSRLRLRRQPGGEQVWRDRILAAAVDRRRLGIPPRCGGRHGGRLGRLRRGHARRLGRTRRQHGVRRDLRARHQRSPRHVERDGRADRRHQAAVLRREPPRGYRSSDPRTTRRGPARGDRHCVDRGRPPAWRPHAGPRFRAVPTRRRRRRGEARRRTLRRRRCRPGGAGGGPGGQAGDRHLDAGRYGHPANCPGATGIPTLRPTVSGRGDAGGRPMVAFGEHHSTSAKTPPPNDRPPAPAPPPPPRWRMWRLVLGVLLTVVLLVRPSMGSGTPNHDYNYSKFVRAVTTDKVRSATIDSNGKVTGSLKNGDDYTSQIPTVLRDLRLAPLLSDHHVQITGKGPPGASLLSIL